MAAIFDVIVEDFMKDMEAIRSLVVTFSSSTHPPRARIAAANSATLLVAATFEEFIREMAREYARAIVTNATSFDELPKDLASTAWKRTMDGLGKIKFGSQGEGADIFGVAQARFAVIHDFCKGDLSKDIYRELIHNEMNMRPSQLNGLFKVAGLRDVCAKCSDKQPMLDIFGETEAGKAHGRFLASLENFFERRNAIAHALNAGQSDSPDQIETDIDMLMGFAKSLAQTLEAAAPTPLPAQQDVGVGAEATGS